MFYTVHLITSPTESKDELKRYAYYMIYVKRYVYDMIYVYIIMISIKINGFRKCSIDHV